MMTPLRILMPQRFDVLGRSMDSGNLGMWLALDEIAEVVFWGPGMPGYRPGPLDAVAQAVQSDLVLLPELQPVVPDLWHELWAGVDRCACPVAMFVSDPGAGTDVRQDLVRRVRPRVLVTMTPRTAYSAFEDVAREVGAEIVSVPLGHDPALFHAPARDVDRPIDILVSGAANPEAYPMRARLKSLALTLGGRANVVDLAHPGYWQMMAADAARGRGQPRFADLLRRSKLAITGTTWGIASQRYFETAACGTIGIGNLPDLCGTPGLAEAMLVVDEGDRDDEIVERILALLGTPAELARMRATALDVASSTSLVDRARELDSKLRALISADPNRGPSPAPSRAHALLVTAAPDPFGVPSPRRDWECVWDADGEGSRSRRLEAILRRSSADIVVLALDPDAALPADATYLAELLRASDVGVVARPARAEPSDDLVASGWVLVAAWREMVLGHLTALRGRHGPEQAVLRIASAQRAHILPDPAVDDPACELARLDAAAAEGWPLPAAAGGLAAVALRRALKEGRLGVAHEIAGWTNRMLPVEDEVVLPAAPAEGVPPEDPELDHLHADEHVLFPLDPRCADHLEAVVEYAREAPEATPALLVVPTASGAQVAAAQNALVDALIAGGVDLDATPDMVLVDRPLLAAEIAWLTARAQAMPSHALRY